VPREVAPADRVRLESLANEALVSTRVEGPSHFMRPEIFEYLLNHPDFASHVARALGLARYRIWREPDGLWLDDGWGTRGRFTLVHAERGRRLYHAHGAFEQRFLPAIRGEAVAVFEYQFRPEPDGRTLVTTTASGYLQVDNHVLRALGAVAMPFVQAKADREAGQLLRVFARASQVIETEPARVYARLGERADVPRRELAEFRELLRLP
jgi:hypothetical protein